MSEPDQSSAKSVVRKNVQEPVLDLEPRIVGYFVLPGTNETVDASRMLARDPEAVEKLAARPVRNSISVETITGGVPDASDQLPEGTIIIST